MYRRSKKIGAPATLQRFFLYGTLFLALCAALFVVYRSSIDSSSVNSDVFIPLPQGGVNVELAITHEEREVGLSGRPHLDEDEGMLFIFEYPGKYGFWMKDMNFAIDIVWISEKGTVVHIEENVKPSSFPKVFMNGPGAKYVLEVQAGSVKKRGLYLGTQLYLPELVTKFKDTK